MNKLIELLKELERDRFYGRLEVNFRCGHAELARVEKSIKLEDEKDRVKPHGYHSTRTY